ncbi:MAG: PEP-CTERM sorting domain-containing protein [Gammaproteobacteria bacterium]|nr:PEP-CTERM sorting domain-containing protein [Gammaproteobacteria bacterium]
MKFKHIVFSMIGGCLLAVSANAGAITIMVGDNDGYGYGIADGADLPVTSNDCTWCFDNRTAGELTATDGAQYTDFEAYAYVSFDIAFDVLAYSGINNVIFSMDVSGIQMDWWGASSLLLDGVNFSAGLPVDQGIYGSGVFAFELDAAALADGMLNVSFTGGDGWDHIAFDYFALDFDVASVPEPSVLGLLGLGLVMLGFSGIKKYNINLSGDRSPA